MEVDEKDERNKKNIKPAFLAAGIAGTLTAGHLHRARVNLQIFKLQSKLEKII